MRLVLDITRHELWVALRSRRAVVLAALYLASALLGGLIYVLVVRGIETQAQKLMEGAGADMSAAALSLATQEAYQKLVGFFAGLEPSEIASSIKDSVILPAFLWGSLVFLPFLIVITSFDHVASDLASRTICFSTLRASRREIVFGKLIAQTLLFVSLTIIGSFVLVGLAFALLHSFPLADAIVALPRVWLALVPYGACYLGLTTWCSTANRQPTLALIAALGLMITLRVCGWLAHVPDDSNWAFLQYAAYVSPARYQAGLWRADLGGLATSLGIYLGFAALFVVLAVRTVEARDL